MNLYNNYDDNIPYGVNLEDIWVEEPDQYGCHYPDDEEYFDNE